VVNLENEYLACRVLPEIGAHLTVAETNATTGKCFMPSGVKKVAVRYARRLGSARHRIQLFRLPTRVPRLRRPITHFTPSPMGPASSSWRILTA